LKALSAALSIASAILLGACADSLEKPRGGVFHELKADKG